MIFVFIFGELKALYLLGRRSTTLATLPTQQLTFKCQYFKYNGVLFNKLNYLIF
jgi:hypothetical protein